MVVNNKGVVKEDVKGYILNGMIQGIDKDLIKKEPRTYAYIGEQHERYIAKIVDGKVVTKIGFEETIGKIVEGLLKDSNIRGFYQKGDIDNLKIYIRLYSKKYVVTCLDNETNKHTSINFNIITKKDIHRISRVGALVQDKTTKEKLKGLGITIRINTVQNVIIIKANKKVIICSPKGMVTGCGSVLYERESDFSSLQGLEKSYTIGIVRKALNASREQETEIYKILSTAYDLRRKIGE